MSVPLLEVSTWVAVSGPSDEKKPNLSSFKFLAKELKAQKIVQGHFLNLSWFFKAKERIPVDQNEWFYSGMIFVIGSSWAKMPLRLDAEAIGV